jgi:thiamine-monophosphate kinase
MKTQTLADLGEDNLVRLITAKLSTDASVIIGPGDDCAVVAAPKPGEQLLLKTDTIVEGVHFTSDTPARFVGRKAMARVLSDFAAMAATPKHALVTLIAPPETPVKRVLGLYEGMTKLADEHDVRIVGGETSRGSQLSLTVSMTGTAPKKKWISRSGAKAEDFIAVTGTLGGSIRGKHLKFQPRLAEAQWLVKQARVTAMMDLSDGLAKDLPRLADQSGVGFEIDTSRIPITRGCTLEQALNDGEDYELLITLHADTKWSVLDAFSSAFPQTGLCLIGEVLADPMMRNLGQGGWDHFKP